MQISIDPASVPSPGQRQEPQLAAPSLKMPSPSVGLQVGVVSVAEPSDPSVFDFGESSRNSASDQPVPLGGVPRAMREAAELSGLDPIAELYNESLRYAQEGHLRLSRERLQMLLCMAPDDGPARLMLARVHVAGQRWKDALSALDEAASCGMTVPPSLRRAVEDHLQAEHASEEEHRTALRAREQGEVRALRQEARRLRSEHAQLTTEVGSLEGEVRKWAWATAGVSAVAILFVGASLLFGGSSSEGPSSNEELTEAEVVEPAPGVTVVENEQAGPVNPGAAAVAARAGNALSQAPGLDGSSLELKVKGGKALVSGEVLTHRQRKTAEKVLRGVEGIESTNLDKVVILARTRGTTHTVASGNTLSGIAYEYYGDSSLTKPIEKANGVNSRNLKIGQDLTIPPVE